MSARGGIDLGGTKIQAVVVDDSNKVIGDARCPTPTTGGPQGVADEMAGAMRDAAKAAGLTPSQLVGVGVGSPGEVDKRSGAVANARNLPDWIEPFPLAAVLTEALGCARVRVGNDVQVATDAEFAIGAGEKYKSLLGVFWAPASAAGSSSGAGRGSVAARLARSVTR